MVDEVCVHNIFFCFIGIGCAFAGVIRRRLENGNTSTVTQSSHEMVNLSEKSVNCIVYLLTHSCAGLQEGDRNQIKTT